MYSMSVPRKAKRKLVPVSLSQPKGFYVEDNVSQIFLLFCIVLDHSSAKVSINFSNRVTDTVFYIVDTFAAFVNAHVLYIVLKSKRIESENRNAAFVLP